MTHRSSQPIPHSLSPLSYQHNKPTTLSSPKARLNQPNVFHNNHQHAYTTQPLQPITHKDNILTNIQPLQFTLHRKAKTKVPQLYFQNMGNYNNSSVNANNNYHIQHKHNIHHHYNNNNNSNSSNNSNKSNTGNNNNVNYMNENIIQVNKNINKYNNQNIYYDQYKFMNKQEKRSQQQVSLQNKYNNSHINNTTNNNTYANNTNTNNYNNNNNNNYTNNNNNTNTNNTNRDFNIIKTQLQNQIKFLTQKQKLIHEEYESHCKNLQTQTNYWRQNYLSLKQQYQLYLKSNKLINISDQSIFNKIQLQNNNVVNVQNYKKLQQQVQKYLKSITILEDHMYALNKQKTQYQYQLNFYKEQSRKANAKVFQLQFQIQVQKKQIKQLKEQIKKQIGNKTNQIENFSSKAAQNNHNQMNVNNNIGLNLSLEGVNSSSYGEISSPNHKSKSTSSSFRHKSSRHHRSGSHNSHHHSHHSHHRNYTQSHPQISLQQLNIDMSKQIQRQRHTYRKLQKTVLNHNDQTMLQGLKRLNTKYQKIYQHQQLQNNQYSIVCPNNSQLNKQNNIIQKIQYRFNGI